ncbi:MULTISPECIES: phosphonate ABC transporter substrate-binding protein [Desulfobacula]|uniref:PhnD: phosphonates-binding periplasmic protein n=2 Tax=Desulfobacula TaxID=28222 RepID=K0NKP0_DESTT|nr:MULTISPECIES: phosphonate ABC transporter substrate-binding protein [Desulfobacula]CCK81355.1 PhnD: phosphonates-binding periplasmic protein [Desulfobacula toluolica Tol2]SDU26090.1 phosphonate transport system substrate-binding protein [Desulfobacula phenolica]
MKSILKIIITVFFFTLIAGGNGLASQNWPDKIKLGLIPTEGGADIKTRFKPLIDHLENCLGLKVEPFSASDYAGIITAMAHKHIDFAYFGPKSYVEASARANAQALALELNKNGAKGYYGVIITNKKSNITTMDQATDKTKTFAFTDPNSTSGCLVPSVLFYRDLETPPEKLFREVSFSGSHGASILAVKNNKIQVAATNNIDLDRMTEKGAVSQDDFNIIWKSELIPGSPMCGRKDLPESLKAAFTGALMSFNFNKSGLDKLQTGGYAPVDDTTYDVVRYMKRLKAKLQEKKGN